MEKSREEIIREQQSVIEDLQRQLSDLREINDDNVAQLQDEMSAPAEFVDEDERVWVPQQVCHRLMPEDGHQLCQGRYIARDAGNDHYECGHHAASINILVPRAEAIELGYAPRGQE